MLVISSRSKLHNTRTLWLLGLCCRLSVVFWCYVSGLVLYFGASCSCCSRNCEYHLWRIAVERLLNWVPINNNSSYESTKTPTQTHLNRHCVNISVVVVHFSNLLPTWAQLLRQIHTCARKVAKVNHEACTHATVKSVCSPVAVVIKTEKWVG